MIRETTWYAVGACLVFALATAYTGWVCRNSPSYGPLTLDLGIMCFATLAWGILAAYSLAKDMKR